MKLIQHEIEEEIEEEIEHEFKLKINNGQDSRKQGLWSDVAFSISHCQQQQSYLEVRSPRRSDSTSAYEMTFKFEPFTQFF